MNRQTKPNPSQRSSNPTISGRNSSPSPPHNALDPVETDPLLPRFVTRDQSTTKLPPPCGSLTRRHAASSRSPSPPFATFEETTTTTTTQQQHIRMDQVCDSSSTLSSGWQQQPQQLERGKTPLQLPLPLHQQPPSIPRERSLSQQTIPSLHPGRPYSSFDDSTTLSYDGGGPVSAITDGTSQSSTAASNASQSNRSSVRSAPNRSSSRDHSSRHAHNHDHSHYNQQQQHQQQQQQQRANYIHQQRISDRQQYYNRRATRMLLESSGSTGGRVPMGEYEGGGEVFAQPTLEVPEEIYAVRRAAMTVFRPLTRVWLVFTVGFSATLVLGMSCWMYILPSLPYWLIFLPAWLSHIAMFSCHISSGKALSHFISEANENRQRPDTTDHLDRTEYLPLLQRSLKFGLKAGFISLCAFLFEVLIFVKIVNGNVSLTVVFIPIWIIVLAGIIDGMICKTQHFLRVLCWALLLSSMIMAVLRVDCHVYQISWRLIILPLVLILFIAGGTLVYMVYGHQIGYFRLTESQLTAGILYAMSVLICIVLLVVMGEIITMAKPVEFETRLFIVTLAPLVMSLMGVGAWAVSKDEFRRLQRHGGQSAVHPMKLKFEPEGWTAVEGRGVANIPMFGEVRYEPLDSSQTEGIELCVCCRCYPYDEDDDNISNEGLIPQTNYRYMPASVSRSYSSSRTSHSDRYGVA